MDIYSITTK